MAQYGMMFDSCVSFADVWFSLLGVLMKHGTPSSPRGIETKEILGVSLHVHDNPLHNILVSPDRKLSYRFMLAEWMWMLGGNSDVSSISQWNKNIAQFSDNGVTFAGAYGPRIREQINYMIDKLIEDPSSRQAIISIWRPNPQPSKDIPCTLTFQVLIRDGGAYGIVNMRSSDVWLGLPYDYFNFSMMTNLAASAFGIPVRGVTFNLGSSHMYQKNFKEARCVLANPNSVYHLQSPWLGHMLHYTLQDPRERATEIVNNVSQVFRAAVSIKMGYELRATVESIICHPYLQALNSTTNKEALDVLTSISR